MSLWFGITVLIICILLVALTIANIYYFNRIRTGGTVSNGTATALAWLNFFALLIAVVLLVLAIYYLLTRGRTVTVCGEVKKVKAAPTCGVPAVVEVPPTRTVVQTQKTIPADVVVQPSRTVVVNNSDGSTSTFQTDVSGVSKLEEYSQLSF